MHRRQRLDYTPILDEVTVFMGDHDAVVSLYHYGVRVTLWRAGEHRFLYTERLRFSDYPELRAMCFCDGLLYAECAALVEGLVCEVLQ